MKATLYIPGQPPRTVPPEGFSLPNPPGFAQVTARVAEELNCGPGLVDVLDTGPGYVAYSIFDCEDEPNPTAMQSLNAIARYPYDLEDDNDELRGPILLITKY